MESCHNLQEAVEAVKTGRARAEVLAEQAASRARADACNAFVLIHDDVAERAARAPDGPLRGACVALKDNIDEAGVVAAGGCAAYFDRVPGVSATVVQRLLAAGAVVVGRTNMHELADGVTSENVHHGPVHNPARRGYHPGGSSGGSAVAVAAGIVPLALGTDTGGSVRIPAALCGVVGFKPTAGLVPLDGVMPLSTTLDHVGPLTRTVTDCVLAMQTLAGPRWLEGELLPSTVRLGVLQGFGEVPDAGIAAVFSTALRRLEALGCRSDTVVLPELARGLRLLSSIYGPEAGEYHAEVLRRAPETLGEEVRADLERGLRADPVRRQIALEERAGLAESIEACFETVDLLVSPTTPRPAAPFGSPGSHVYLSYTCPFNLGGQPAVSVPMGEVAGLPVGLQIIGPRGADARVLALAQRFSG